MWKKPGVSKIWSVGWIQSMKTYDPACGSQTNLMHHVAHTGPCPAHCMMCVGLEQVYVLHEAQEASLHAGSGLGWIRPKAGHTCKTQAAHSMQGWSRACTEWDASTGPALYAFSSAWGLSAGLVWLRDRPHVPHLAHKPGYILHPSQ